MPHHRQAEIFIETLAGLRDAERARQAARQQLKHKAQAQRFMKAFWTEVDDGLRPSALPLQGTPSGRETTPRSHSE